jgi:hypothetical protein
MPDWSDDPNGDLMTWPLVVAIMVALTIAGYVLWLVLSLLFGLPLTGFSD